MTNNKADQLPESPPTDDVADERDDPVGSASFPIVGVGASAGGLEAFTQLLNALPADTGMAFVLVQHLAPSHPSALSEILARTTKMPVMEVRDEPDVEPNHVYVIPPDRSMIIAGGALQLLPREGRGAHHPIDQFFRTLAKEQRHRAIGVVLSGTATDGTIGLEEIKAEGGITFAQDATAQHQGMPHSAIASGCVDFVLPPDAIAHEIVRIGHHRYTVPESDSRESDDKLNLALVVQLLLHATGVDFTGYKFNTLYRRVTRRMVFQKLDGLADYVQFLRHTPTELDALYQDILISVTSFFRDKESFEALKSQVFPRLLKDRSRHDPVRLWTLGCSTGQEAYSLAMAFTEAAEAAGSSVPLQLFASDLNAAGIEKARAGVYSKDIAQDVSPERLRRFFTEVDGHYRIAKSIRDACVFSRHNVLADPPFSRIDLISCRNLLIYMEPVLQQRIMPTLHYALKPAGCLWLGGAETIGTYRNLFDAEDAKHKIYAKKPNSNSGHGHFPLQQGGAARSLFTPIGVRPERAADLHREADRVLSTKFAPPGVLVSTELEILQYRGDTGPYLAPVPGKASLSLLKMLREGLLVAVRSAVLRAVKDETPVREEGLQVKSNGGYHDVTVEVIPLKGEGAKAGGFLILFEPSGERPPQGPASPQMRDLPPSHLINLDDTRMAQELAATREYLQSMIEEQEAANEELQSANEEVQSANEELQSSNEELETSKEEIQSSNEELATVNDELINRNSELDRLNNDLVNLLGSVQMAIVMLGPDFRIRRFTPTAEKLLNLVPTDVGRPLCDIKLNLDDIPDLESLLAEVLDTVSIRERNVRDKHGRWYSLRLRPYRTLDHKIDGVVLVLVDVDAMMRANTKVHESEIRYHALFDLVPVAVYSCDTSGVIQDFNSRAAELWGREPSFGDTDERFCGSFKLFRLDGSFIPHEQCPMAEVVSGKISEVRDEEVLIERPDGSRITVIVNIRQLKNEREEITGAINCFYDISDRKYAEQILNASNSRFEALFDASPIGMYLVDAHLRIRLVSGSARPAFGDIEELIGSDFVQVIHKLWGSKIADEIVARFRHTLETGEPYMAPEFSEERDDRKVREYYDWQIHRIALPDGQSGVVCYFMDISARVFAEQSLREAEDRFRNLADNLPQLAWIADAGTDGQVHWFNKVWFDYTGTTLDEMKGSGWKAVHHPDYVDRVAQKFEYHVREGLDWEDTFPLRGKDGQYRWFLSRMKVVRDKFGAVVGIFGTNTDVTLQRQMADELRQNAADMSEADHRKDEFLAMLAHELRNPLAPIRNALQILRLTGGDDTAVASTSKMMERQVGQMVRLVDDLLDVSRISRGKIELRRTQIELASSIHHAVEAVRSQYKDMNHELIVTLPTQPIYLNADPTRLAQVVGNLLNNACKFTDKGGRISLTVEREDEQVVIRVRDSGIGIAAEELPRVFEMFTQLDNSLERSVNGLGIGLALVKNLVEMHDGTVEVHSPGMGKGTEFVVRLPIIVERPEPSRLELSISDSTTATPRRILVVDDNRDSANSLTLLLKCTGNETHTAYDGLEAVESAATLKPDVILLDIGLPKLNGYEVCRRIREQPWSHGMVLIALTGWGQENDRRKSSEAGFDGHLVKPVDLVVLGKLLDDLETAKS